MKLANLLANLAKLVNALMPAYDKLKHLFVFTLFFNVLLFWFSDYWSFGVVAISAFAVEMLQKLLLKGNNNAPEVAKDIFFSLLIPSIQLIYLTYFI